MTLRVMAMAVLCAVWTSVSAASEFRFTGFGDVRLVIPPATDSYLDGGLGKLRFGADDASPAVKVGDFIGEGSAQFDEAWLVQVDAKVSPQYGAAVDLLEAFAQYAPKSNSEW